MCVNNKRRKMSEHEEKKTKREIFALGTRVFIINCVCVCLSTENIDRGVFCSLSFFSFCSLVLKHDESTYCVNKKKEGTNKTNNFCCEKKNHVV